MKERMIDCIVPAIMGIVLMALITLIIIRHIDRKVEAECASCDPQKKSQCLSWWIEKNRCEEVIR